MLRGQKGNDNQGGNKEGGSLENRRMQVESEGHQWKMSNNILRVGSGIQGVENQ